MRINLMVADIKKKESKRTTISFNDSVVEGKIRGERLENNSSIEIKYAPDLVVLHLVIFQFFRKGMIYKLTCTISLKITELLERAYVNFIVFAYQYRTYNLIARYLMSLP